MHGTTTARGKLPLYCFTPIVIITPFDSRTEGGSIDFIMDFIILDLLNFFSTLAAF